MPLLFLSHAVVHLTLHTDNAETIARQQAALDAPCSCSTAKVMTAPETPPYSKLVVVDT